MLFSGERILVTGASSGIGRAIALECVAQGAVVLACGRNSGRLEAARSACAAPERWHCLQRDLLAEMEDIPQWIDSLVKTHGKLWACVHAAGVGIMDTLRSYSLAEARQHMDINFHVPLLLAKGFCNKRVSLEGGALLCIASASAVYPEKGHLVYGAAKAALIAACKSISQEVAPRKIRVHCLSPGIVDTPLQAQAEAYMGSAYRQQQLADYPFGFGKPEDVAHMAAFLLSDRAAWITGQNYVLDGGRY